MMVFWIQRATPSTFLATHNPAWVATFWRPATLATPRPCQDLPTLAPNSGCRWLKHLALVPMTKRSPGQRDRDFDSLLRLGAGGANHDPHLNSSAGDGCLREWLRLGYAVIQAPSRLCLVLEPGSPAAVAMTRNGTKHGVRCN